MRKRDGTELRDPTSLASRLRPRRHFSPYLVHDNRLALAELRDTLVGKIQDPPRSTHKNLHRVVQAHDIVLQAGSAGADHALDAHVLPKLADDGRSLQCQLARGDQDEDLDIVLLHVRLLEAWNNERRGLARAVFRARQHISILQNDGNGALLDGRRLLEALLENPH